MNRQDVEEVKPRYLCVTNPHCLGLHPSKHMVCTAGEQILSEVVNELRRYIDFQQKLNYREYAASTQQVLNRFELVIATGEVRSE